MIALEQELIGEEGSKGFFFVPVLNLKTLTKIEVIAENHHFTDFVIHGYTSTIVDKHFEQIEKKDVEKKAFEKKYKKHH